MASALPNPSPKILLEICATAGIDLDDVAYIGDSMARDVLMARTANVFAVWAVYGSKHDPATTDPRRFSVVEPFAPQEFEAERANAIDFALNRSRIYRSHGSSPGDFGELPAATTIVYVPPKLNAVVVLLMPPL